MYLIRTTLLVCCCCFLWTVQAQRDTTSPGGTRTLQQYIRQASDYQTGLKTADLQIEGSHIREKMAEATFLPVVHGSLTNGISIGRGIDPYTNTYVNQQIAFSSWQLYSEWTLLDGHQRRHQLDQAQYTSQIAGLTRQKFIDQLTLQVLEACLAILQYEDQLALAVNQAALTQQELNRLALLDQAGAISPAAALDMKAQLAGEELAVIQANSRLRQSRLRLGQLTGTTDWENIRIDRAGLDKVPVPYPASPRAIAESAQRNFATIKIADLNVAAAAKDVQISTGARQPRLSLFAGLGTNYSSAATRLLAGDPVTVPTDQFINVNGLNYPVLARQPVFSEQRLSYLNQFVNNINANIGLQLQVPVWDGRIAKNKAALAQIAVEEASLSSESARQELQNAIEEAYLSLTAAKERYDAILLQIEALEAAFKITETRFRATIIPGTEYQAAKNNLLSARIQLVTARYEYQFYYKMLDFYQGRR